MLIDEEVHGRIRQRITAGEYTQEQINAVRALCEKADQEKMALQCPCSSTAVPAYIVLAQFSNGAPHPHPVDAWQFCTGLEAFKAVLAEHKTNPLLAAYFVDVVRLLQKGDLLPLP